MSIHAVIPSAGVARSGSRRGFGGGELGLAAGSVALVLALFFGALHAAVRWLDLPDPDFRYENELEMWRPDPLLGFANRPDFLAFAFGDVRVETNGRGFRGSAPTPARPAPGTTRLVGVGDSVMWGTGVDAEDSLLGLLERRLDADSPHEAINAAVVGYSSLQEQLQLERDVLPLAPDLVLVNYCGNDVLPTEDPFGTARGLYLHHLETLAAEVRSPEAAREAWQQVAGVLRSPRRVWPALRRLERKKPGLRSRVAEWFVELPVARMAERSRDAGVRLVFLFVPGRRNDAGYARAVERLKHILAERGAGWVDLQEALAPEPGAQPAAAPGFGSDWPRPPQLEQLARWLHFRRLHEGALFIDTVHPSRRGNALIAERVYRYLTGQ